MFETTDRICIEVHVAHQNVRLRHLKPWPLPRSRAQASERFFAAIKPSRHRHTSPFSNLLIITTNQQPLQTNPHNHIKNHASPITRFSRRRAPPPNRTPGRPSALRTATTTASPPSIHRSTPGGAGDPASSSSSCRTTEQWR